MKSSEKITKLHRRFGIPFSLAVLALGIMILTSCASVQGTKTDYFGFRNSIPAPASELEQEVGQQAWTNPMQSGITSSVAFVPVITPWYDSWSMFARPSARFLGMTDRFGWNSPWGIAGDPFWGGGFGMGWGANSWAMGGFYDPFWGCNSSFMFYSSPWQRFNPYFGNFTPFGFQRPLGWWGSNNFVNFNNNLNVAQIGNQSITPIYTQPTMREAGLQRSYSNNAAMYNNANSYNNAGYIGTYSGSAGGGAFSRGQANAPQYQQNNPGNRASQYNTASVSNGGGNTITSYNNYYQPSKQYSSGSPSGRPYSSGSNTLSIPSRSSYSGGGYYTSTPSSGSRSSYGSYGGGSSYGSSSYGNSSSSWGRSGSGYSSGGGYSGGSYSSGSSSGASRSSGGYSSGGGYSGGGGGAMSRGKD